MQASEPVLLAVGFAAMGGPPAAVAYLRGRSAVGWFFLGVLIAGVVFALFPTGLRRSSVAVLPALLVAPILLLLLPRRGRKRARKHVEPQDWSSTAAIGRDPGREHEAGSAGPRDAQP